MEQKKWYDNKLVVYLLLVIFFPVGLYALWKNNSFSKGIKIGLTTIVMILVILIGSSDEDKQKNESSPVLDTQVEETPTKLVDEKQVVTFQEYFLEQKAELYNSDYLNAKNDAAKLLFQKKTEKLTKQLLDSTNNTLTNWVGTISRVSLAYGHNQRDMELLKTMSPNAVIEKYPEGRDINIYIIVGEKELDKATYLAEVYQEFNPKKNERGIKPNSSLYETVLSLKEGQQVVFSAKIKRTMDTNGKNNEQFTGFNIELTEIKSAK